MKRTFLYLLFIIACIAVGRAQDNYPVPKATKNLLFYIQHDQGHNTYIYEVNRDNRGISKAHPIKVSRQLFDEDASIKPLTYIQNKFAYGVKTKALSKDAFEVTLAAYAKQKFFLRNTDKGVVIETSVNGTDMVLKKIFLKQQAGTSGINTKLDYILFYGIRDNGKEVVEKLNL